MKNLAALIIALSALIVTNVPAHATGHFFEEPPTGVEQTGPSSTKGAPMPESRPTGAATDPATRALIEEKARKQDEALLKLWFDKFSGLKKRLSGFAGDYNDLRKANKFSTHYKVVKALTQENLDFQSDKGIFAQRNAMLKKMVELKLPMQEIDRKTMIEELAKMEKLDMMVDYGKRMVRLSQKANADDEDEANLANQSAAKATLVEYRTSPNYLWANVPEARPFLQSSSHFQDIRRVYDAYFRNPPANIEEFDDKADSFVRVMGIYADTFTRPGLIRPSN